MYVFILIVNFMLNTSESNFVKFSGNIMPQGLYKIIIWDRQKYPAPSNCEHIMEYINKTVNFPDGTIRLSLNLFKYQNDRKLEELAKCFVNFQAVESDGYGMFEIKLNPAIAPIFMNFFPINDDTSMIRSDEYPQLFLQNGFRKNKLQLLSLKPRVYHFFNHIERFEKLDKMLHRWLSEHYEEISNGDAFFLKAFLRTIASILLSYFMNGYIIQQFDLKLLREYGTELYYFLQSGGNLAEKLAKIDGMPILMRNFCRFLHFESGLDWLELELSIWKNICESIKIWSRIIRKIY